MNDTILPLTTLLIVHYKGNHKAGPAAMLFHMGKPWTLGMGPTISIDWKEDSDNRLTFPIGLGITKTTRWGKTPVNISSKYSLAP